MHQIQYTQDVQDQNQINCVNGARFSSVLGFHFSTDFRYLSYWLINCFPDKQ